MAKSAKKEAVILTPTEAKRVAIAKDALKQVQLEKIVVLSSNGYIVSNELDEKIDTLASEIEAQGNILAKVELREHLDKMLNEAEVDSGYKCEVCAKGALFLSAVRKFNNFSLSDAQYGGLDDCASSETRKIFGQNNADLIETYFEKTDPYKLIKDDEGYMLDFRWSDGWKNDTERLVIILKNVIANKGTFKPNQLKWKSIAQMDTSGW